MSAALRLALLAPALLLLAACQTIPQHKVHQSLLNASNTASGDVIVLPLDVKVKEFSAGGLQEEVPAWSAQANSNFKKLLSAKNDNLLAGSKLRFLPELGDEDMAKIKEHMALSDLMMGNVIFLAGPFGGPAWVHKAKQFDYTLGPGLSFLADKTGADKALILLGEDVHSSEGRKAAFLVAAAFGVGIPLGHNVAIAALVDLRTGDLLWMHHTVSVGDVSFLKEEDTQKVFTELFKPYPGIEEYRKFAEAK